MDLNAFLMKLFEQAEGQGFEAFEAYCSDGEEFEINVFKGEIIGYTVSGALGVSFRVLHRGKMGYASTQVLDDEAVGLLIEGAKANAELVENEDEQFIYDGATRNYPTLNLYNPAIDSISSAAKIDMALELEKKATSLDPRASQVEHCMLMSMAGGRRIVNSKGVDVSYRDNGIGVYVSVAAREGEQVASGASYVFTRDPGELDIGKVACEAVKESVDGLAAKPVKSASYRVALRNDVAASLIEAFTSVFSADMAQKGLSLLKGREGTQIASDAVTLLDDPHHEKGLASSPFDAEGVATKKRAIIAQGTLTTLQHNLKTAKKQGCETTANASKGSYAAPIGVAPTNLYIHPSETPPSELFQAIGDGLLITDLMGLHSGANAVSGDFSLGAKGYWLTGGELGEAVNQITIAGNFFELLKNIRGVGSDLRFGFPGASCVGSPTLDVGELTVAGM